MADVTAENSCTNRKTWPLKTHCKSQLQNGGAASQCWYEIEHIVPRLCVSRFIAPGPTIGVRIQRERPIFEGQLKGGVARERRHFACHGHFECMAEVFARDSQFRARFDGGYELADRVAQVLVAAVSILVWFITVFGVDLDSCTVLVESLVNHRRPPVPLNERIVCPNRDAVT